MSPPLLISTYSEQFVHPGRRRPALSRPSSVTRRNNPHPRPDFLVPLRLLSSHRSPRRVDAGPPVGRPLFPPVRYLSFQETRPELPHIPFIGSSATLPSAGRLRKLQPTAAGMNLQRQMSASNPQRRLQTTRSPVAPQKHQPPAEYCRYRSHSTLDSCGGYSCFNVVKPFQAGHFTIHPEFVSEYLR